jgi:predicted nucleic acid-binding protein
VVIDTSAILAVLLNEPERPAILERTTGVALLAPGSLSWEVGNALSSFLKRHRLTVAQAQRILRTFSEVPIRTVAIDMARAVTLAGALSLYAYDAYMLEAARQHACPLLTLDHGLLRAAAVVGVPTVEVALS